MVRLETLLGGVRAAWLRVPRPQATRASPPRPDGDGPPTGPAPAQPTFGRERRVIGRAYYLAAALAVLVGLAAAFLLLPREQELALMHMKDQQYHLARQAYERRLEAGDMSVSVVMPLVQVYLYYGEVERAIELMEQFVAAHPEHVEARKRLADFYRDAQRSSDHLRSLEALAVLAPSPEILRELAEIYVINGPDSRLLAVLEQLVESFDATPQEHLTLARMQAALGRLDRAAATLEALTARGPEALTTEIVMLLASLLIDLGRPDDALAWARLHLDRQWDAEAATALALMFDQKDRPAQGLSLIEPFADIAVEYPPLLAELVNLEQLQGRAETAFRRLLPYHQAGRLPAQLHVPFIDLALRQGQHDLAFAAADTYGPETLPAWLLTGLVEAVIDRDRLDIARTLVGRLGDDFLAGRPVLAAQLALLLGDEPAVRRWIAEAEGLPDLRLDQQIALALLYQHTGRDADALALLRRLAEGPDAPEAVMLDLAQLYLKLGRAAEGVDVLEAVRARHPSPRVEAAWALLTAATRGDEAVLAWLRETPEEELSDALLTDLYFIAMDNRTGALALAVAERLYARRPETRHRLYLAQALSAAGRPREALVHLRQMLPGDREVQGAYLEALSGALKAGEPVREELLAYLNQRLADPDLTKEDREALVAGLLEAGAYAAALPILEVLAREHGGDWFWAFVDAATRAGRTEALVAFLASELARPDLARKQREERLYLMLEQGEPAAALPYLRDFAERYGGPWIFAYDETLTKLGRIDEAMAFLERVAQRPELDAEQRRGIAFRLLEAGRRAAAERVFLALAEGAPPTDPAVRQLLYLWGPRPTAEQLDWLEMRAETAPDEDARAAWMTALINAGAAERALALAQPDGGLVRSPVFDVYLEALGALRMRVPLAEGLNRRIPLEVAPEKLRRLGRLAAANRLPAQAQAAYEKLLTAKPDDLEALREAGIAASAEGEPERARERLARYFELTEGEAETNYIYGDILASLGWSDLAAFHYGRALKLIEREATQSYEIQLIRANILARLGEVDQAVAAFEALRKERPDDPNSRADFAALLMESKQYDRAEQVLSAD